MVNESWSHIGPICPLQHCFIHLISVHYVLTGNLITNDPFLWQSLTNKAQKATDKRGGGVKT